MSRLTSEISRLSGQSADVPRSAKKIHAGIEVGMRQMSERGWHPDLCLVRPDGTAVSAIERQLSLVRYDCVLIGGGIRIPPKSLLLFEEIVNAVHKFDPAPRSHSIRARKIQPMRRDAG
jgi:hypothetical protein